ncbi:hypothetical protein [Candidatus Methylobacter oryzae]|uniref:Uncharacterized protein n=1 Tax=Candidatus Methylobacter oryzae TaxID=2497749 RepID=A0ABY3CDW1_9GAMM|nr:hypothetical protein [Candidatus Methylobacter oryzae]TRX00886.1 hypothetical protein EKO24_004590 [Candidatus Methylobacter oryzae]
MATNLILFFLYLVAVVYFLGLALTGKSTPTNIKDAYMYAGTLAMIGIISEVAINSFYRTVFDSPLWLYQVAPIHGGDTSVFAFFQWPLFGYHLYFVRKKIQSYRFKYEAAVFAFAVSVDALLLETFANISSAISLNTFIFYYLPGDLGHFTSLRVYPFYLLGGAILNETFKRFKTDPLFFGNLGFVIAFIFVFL